MEVAEQQQQQPAEGRGEEDRRVLGQRALRNPAPSPGSTTKNKAKGKSNNKIIKEINKLTPPRPGPLFSVHLGDW